MTQLHYLFTDGCGGVTHCHVVAWPTATPPHPFADFLHSGSANRHILECGDPGWGLWAQIRTQARFSYNAPNRQV